MTNKTVTLPETAAVTENPLVVAHRRLSAMQPADSLRQANTNIHLLADTLLLMLGPDMPDEQPVPLDLG